MNRDQLEHILRASASVAGCRDLVVIGSQALIGSFPHAPEDLLSSMEADVFPLDVPDMADVIDGCIGELSPFHETFGYYAHGVGPETAILPNNWRTRLVRLDLSTMPGTTAWCLAPVDLAVSKLAAGRDKDLAFVRGLIREGLITRSAVDGVLHELPVETAERIGQSLRLCVPHRFKDR